MKTRIITAAIGIFIYILLSILGEVNSLVVAIAISLVNAVMCGEYISAKKLSGNLKILIPCVLFAFLIPLLSYSAVKYIPVYLFTLVIFIISVISHKNTKIEDILFAFGGVMLLSLSMASFVILACAENRFTAFWMVMVLGIPWVADSAAYFIGNAKGKRKLCPEISPKKTVEGAVGGVVCGTVAPLLFGLIFLLIYGNVTVNFAILPLLGLLNSVISIFGDLVFSVIKRSCNIKDFGSIMPGHGGLLDRFDSVIFCIPVIFIFSQYITIIA